MKLKSLVILASALLTVCAASSGLAIQPVDNRDERNAGDETYPESESYRHAPLVVDVWTDQGDGGIYYTGDRIRVYFRVSRDCYITIYDVDTQGYIHLLFPAGSYDDHFAQAGVTYRVPSRRSPYDLVINGPSGIEYIEAVASIEPFRTKPPWYLDPEYGDWEDNPWSLYGSDYEDYADNYDYYVDRGIVRGDPFIGIESINRRIIPADYPSSNYATAYTSFYVDSRVQYPRYLCFDCHRDHAGFDPYGTGCVVFDIRMDRTWVYSPRVVRGGDRPRYYYRLKDAAPPTYKGERHFWSSGDGLTALRREFSVLRPKVEPIAPRLAPGTGERLQEPAGPSAIKRWKAGKEPSVSERTGELRKRLEAEGLLRTRGVEQKQKEYQESPVVRQRPKNEQGQKQKEYQGSPGTGQKQDQTQKEEKSRGKTRRDR